MIISLFLLQSAQYLNNSEQLNVYSFRKYELIKPVISHFEEKTGIKVNIVNGKSHYLLKRLKEDGKHSQADVILSSDLTQLHSHKSLLQAIPGIANWPKVPMALKDEQQFWISVSIRSRALFTQKNSQLIVPKYFSELSKSKYNGQFCIRAWQHSYNKNLAATLLASKNKSDSQWLKGATKLLAKRPSGGDRDQLRALAKSQCQFAFANHYYWTMMKRSKNKQDKDLASLLNIHYLKNSAGNTPISTTTAAIAKFSPNKENAAEFINFLLSSQAQKIYADSLAEFPVINIEKDGTLPFKPDLSSVKPSLALLDEATKHLPN